jgi:hypothetical protein
MIKLNKIVFKDEDNDWNVIISDTGYLLYQESSNEYAIDYTVADKDLCEVDGGQLCWGEYNEITEMYDIPSKREGFTYKEFFEAVNECDEEIQFNKNSVKIENRDVIEFIWEQVN